MSFINKLNEVVNELKSNPEIFVAHYEILPADLEAIAAVLEKYPSIYILSQLRIFTKNAEVFSYFGLIRIMIHLIRSKSK